jgi:glyoxylase-like metal-dependent hydrolase (beta-lactamase superfamily II)
MYRERIADDVYVFTSGLYAQVTAGAVVTPEGAVVIDTLPFPSETRQIIDFLRQRSPAGIRYLILTHHHADHTLGASLFRGVPVIAHALCHQLLSERGAGALVAARGQNPELAEVSLRLPDIVFDRGDLSVRLGGKTLVLTHLPGHSADGTAAYLKDDKILFASDAVTPVPMIVDGDARRLIESLRRIKSFGLESIVQGHGEMILRGEINEAITSNVTYLSRILALAAQLIRDRQPRDAVRAHSIESCGKSRIPLHGLVQQFHTANLYVLYDLMGVDRELFRLGLRMLAEREAARIDSTKRVKKKPPVPAPKKKPSSVASQKRAGARKKKSPARGGQKPPAPARRKA